MAEALLKWSAPVSRGVLLTHDGTGQSLKNLSNDAGKISAEINNESNKDRFANFELRFRGASAPSDGKVVELYIVSMLDGSNYEDGGDALKPGFPNLFATFVLRAVATAQRVIVKNVLIPAGKFKVLIWNSSGVATTNANDENELKMWTHNEALQAMA